MRILFVGIELNRTDLLKTVEPATQAAQCFFLENFSPVGTEGSLAYDLGSVIFWKGYSDAFSLLEAIKPDKIVFILLDNYYHLALFFAAKTSGIPVHYLDHGIRFEHEPDIMNALEIGQATKLQRVIRRNKLKSWLVLARTPFFIRTLARLPESVRAIAIQTFLSRSRNFYGGFMQQCGAQIIPDKIIAYSPETLAFYKRLFGIKKASPPVIFTGIPSLDEYASLNLLNSSGSSKGVLFIDQPMHEQQLAGWTLEHKTVFWERLSSEVQQQGRHLYIKPHPRNDNCYDQIEALCSGNVTILSTLSADICSQIDYAGSFNSTLLLGICAMEDIVSFCVEMNPVPIKPEFSHGITKYGVATAVRSFPELSQLFMDKERLLAQKKAAIPAYIENMLYLFDGKAKERINRTLLSD